MPKSQKSRGRVAKTEPLQEKGQSTADTSLTTSNVLPTGLQQIILNTFQSIIPTNTDKDLNSTIQEVKGHLFNRDFETAFGKLEYTQAYAVRWSAARALGYTTILLDPGREYLFKLLNHEPGGTLSKLVSNISSAGLDELPFEAVCIGGGAGAEIIAFAATQRLSDIKKLRITAVDAGHWSETLQQLQKAIYKPAHLPSYASQTVKDRPENQPLLHVQSDFTISFVHRDALIWADEEMRVTISKAVFITIMFTLNELFTASLPKTTAFLLALTEHMQKGSHLLVVDSPGSYSEIKVGKMAAEHDDTAAAVKKYPMKWLLDHTLLEVAKQHNEAVWEKVEEEDSLWFRLDQKDKAKLKYPVELENMRYQLHCYQKL